MSQANCWLTVCVGVLAAALFACKQTDPDAVCKHMIKLAAEENRKEVDEYDDCVEEVEKIERKLGDKQYKKFANCVLGEDDFERAVKKCDPDDYED